MTWSSPNPVVPAKLFMAPMTLLVGSWQDRELDPELGQLVTSQWFMA